MHRFCFAWLVVAGLIISGTTWAAWQPILIHAHVTCDDGHFTPEKLKQKAISKGYAGMIVTPHTDCFIEQWGSTHKKSKIAKVIAWPHFHDWPNDHANCKAKIESLTDEQFVSISGAEMTVDPDPKNSMCHIGRLTVPDDPLLHAGDKRPHEVSEVLSRLREDGEDLFVINHPHLCRELELSAQDFTAVELMNDAAILGTKRSDNYRIALDVLLKASTNEKPLCAIGGQDFHIEEQWLDGGVISTFVDTASLTRGGILNGVRDCRTVATRGVIIKEITTPGTKTTELDLQESPVIQGKVVFWQNHYIPKTQLNVYKNGQLYKKLPLEITGKTLQTFTTTFSFTDTTLLPGGEASYIVEIPNRLITSTYRFRKKKSPAGFTPPPKEVVVDPKVFMPRAYPAIGIKSKDGYPDYGTPLEGYMRLQHPDVQLATTFIICIAAYGYRTVDYRLNNCFEPGMLITVVNGSREALNLTRSLFTMPGSSVCGLSETCQFGPFFQPSSFLRTIGPGDYLCVHDNRSKENACVAPPGQQMHVGQRFGVCSPQHNITVGSQGNITNCTTFSDWEFTVTAPRASGGWTLRLPNDAPITTGGKAVDFFWLLPR